MLSPTIPRIRKNLAIDALVQGLRKRFEAIPDPRRAASTVHSQADGLMVAFAMFSLKELSLLAFENRRKDQSLMNLYRICLLRVATWRHAQVRRVKSLSRSRPITPWAKRVWRSARRSVSCSRAR